MKRLSLFFIIVLALTTGLMVTVSAQTNQPTIPETPEVSWDGRRPLNVLILGMDRRPGATDSLNARTDVIMIARLDPVNERVGVLHIPRDTHLGSYEVEELVRVNTLLVRGERIEEGYGPQFAMETFELNFGMYLDGYIAFDFVGFIDFIDFIGGITLDVPFTISDPTYPDMNYGFDPFFIRAGVQSVDGRTALKYARTRHQDNDYVRGLRQMQVVDGVRVQMSEPETLQRVILNAPELLRILSGHVYTNLTPEQALFAGTTLIGFEDDDFHYGSLNEQYSFEYSGAGSNGIVRVPDRELLPQLLIETFGEDYWR
jgi:polyisoprenyl-teichoic acid--peptidoglycan teichoic acid transferase